MSQSNRNFIVSMLLGSRINRDRVRFLITRKSPEEFYFDLTKNSVMSCLGNLYCIMLVNYI